MELDKDFIKYLKKTLEDTKFAIEGGSDPKAKKIRKTSYIFLSMPDPTSISTMIGITLYTTSKVLEKRKIKGIKDYIAEYNFMVKTVKDIIKDLQI